MRVVLDQGIAARLLGHGRVVGTRIGEAELAKGNLAVLVVPRLDRVALEHVARAVGEGELKGELPLPEAGLAAAREHLGELGNGRRGGGGVEGVGEGGGGDLACRDGALGLGSLGSVHRGLVAIGGALGHRVGGPRGQPRDPRRLAVLELEGRLAALERRVTVGAGHAAARGIGGLDRKLKCLVRVDRQALARRDGLGDVELARLHGVGHGEAVLGVAGDLRAVALDGHLGHGVVDHGAGGITLRQVRENTLPAVRLAQGDRIDDGLAVLEIYFDLIRMGNPGVLPGLFDWNVDVLGLTDDDTAVGADAASQRRRIARDRQRRLTAAEVIHILTHHRFKRDVRRGVGKGQGLAVVTIGRESRDFGVCCRNSAVGVKQPTVSVPADLSAARSAVGQGQFVFGVFEAGEDQVVSRPIGPIPGDQAAVLDVDLGISGRAEPHAAALLFRMVINNASVFDIERAIAKILVAFAIHATAHAPSSIALDLARAERDVIRIGIDASAGGSGVARYGAALHGESGLLRFAALAARVNHTHSAAFAFALARHNVVLNLSTLHGELGVALNMNCSRGIVGTRLQLTAPVAGNLTTSHRELGSLVFVLTLAVREHRTASITAVALDPASAHVKAGVAPQNDARRCKPIAIGGPGNDSVVTDNAAAHNYMSAAGRANGTAIRMAQLALLDNAALHGKRGIVSRHVDGTRVITARGAVIHNGLVREHNCSLARNNGALVVTASQGRFPRQLEGRPLGNIDQYGDAAILCCQDGIGLIRRDLNHLPGRNRERGAELHVLFQSDDGFLAIGGLADQLLKGLGAVIAHGIADAVFDGLARVDDIDARAREVLRAGDVVHAVFDCDLLNRAVVKHTRGYIGEAAPDRHILHAIYAREGCRANGSYGIRNGKVLRQRAVIEGVVANCLKCPGKLDGDVALDKGPVTDALQAVAEPHDLNRRVAERIVRNVLKRGQVNGRLQIFAALKSSAAHVCYLA